MCIYIIASERMGARRKWVTRGVGSHFGNSGTDYVKARSQTETQSPLVLLRERPLRDPPSRKEREKDGAPAFCAQGKRGPAADPISAHFPWCS
jgi:hypothetical protein